ncbi:16S rRNA (guanine(966)-N(2))-methyltransferase RsmD [Sphingomonas bacterium]|uniref:16S rRNA (guanine(966)-N(2))-methyltransferase RsmD n=1 Tax=Sphingomonas bacterium TaxID=1895847 RepID=UPI0015766D5C|nr:16S rRNA (guanine(966)-N(2))-methyltransferase RsmD [Sphingomonas bacterium]
MRIIAGRWRGRSLVVPPGATTRPTADRTREALFSMLVSRLGAFEELRVADIFAGTGALGFEALSRGAAQAIFVDHDRAAIAAIRANAAKLGAEAETDIVPIAVSALGPARAPCDILFFDPPYGSGGAGALLEKLTRLGWAAPTAWAAIETGAAEMPAAKGWHVDADRVHGKARLTLLCRRPAAPAG